MTKAIPDYFSVNDRPVKVVRMEDGGMDVLALDLRTGEWVRDFSKLEDYINPDRDVDVLTKEQFDELVELHRSRTR